MGNLVGKWDQVGEKELVSTSFHRIAHTGPILEERVSLMPHPLLRDRVLTPDYSNTDIAVIARDGNAAFEAVPSPAW